MKKKSAFSVKVAELAAAGTYGVSFNIDHQYFRLDVQCDELEAGWFAAQLRKALGRLAGGVRKAKMKALMARPPRGSGMVD